jgi:acyl-CoA hydrolase
MPNQVSLPQLVGSLRNGETVYLAGSAGEPSELTQLLVARPTAAAGVRFVTSFIPGINQGNLAAEGSGRRMRVFFMQPQFRSACAAGLIDFSPMNYLGIQQFLVSPESGIDTVIVQVSEPDARGLCSLGASVEFMPGVLNGARRILAILNPRVPSLPHSVAVPMESFAMVASSTGALAQYDAGPPNAIADRIAMQLAGLIPSGATLQLGLGIIPNQLLRSLRGHRHLALHSGLLSDSMLELLDSGALRTQRPLVTTVVVGSEALYAKLPDIAGLHLEPVSHTHNPEVLCQVARLFAINSALEVDLMGQVNAEMLGGAYVSGPGGLPDFAAAAHRQPDGLSIITLPSTDSSGRHSRIVPRFASGTPVSVPQHDVDAVVTEYGVAMLRGQCLKVRLRRLIAVAHPDHRAALERAGS